MSESSASYPSVKLGEKSLVRLGGSLGIAATSISLLIFTVGCFGFSAVFVALPVIPLILSVIGIGATLIGGTIKKSASIEDTQTFIAMFVNLLGLVGAILEIAIWQNWNIFYTPPVTGA